MKYPGEVFTPSARIYRPTEEPKYPMHDRTIQVTACGRIWLVTFLDIDLGYFDEDSKRLEPIDNPFSRKVLPMSSE